MNSKVGIFGVLFATMMLLIPATSMVNAQQYDSYYEDEYYYEEYYYPNDKKEKGPPMLLVKKDVLYCDVIASGTGFTCLENGNTPGPESDRYVQECTATTGGISGAICNNLDEEFFNIIITDEVEFAGSEEGTKLNFGERYTVTEDVISGEILQSSDSQCQEAGFDGAISIFSQELLPPITNMCVVFEGDCSGVIQDGELKECTIKNYVVAAGI